MLWGYMLHVWWECPKIRHFWNRVFLMFRKMTGLPIEQQPHLALRNDFPTGWPLPLKHLVYFMLLEVKITIAGTWKTPSVSFLWFKHKILWSMIHEKIACIINDQNNLFEQMWEPWTSYIHVPPALDFWCYTASGLFTSQFTFSSDIALPTSWRSSYPTTIFLLFFFLSFLLSFFLALSSLLGCLITFLQVDFGFVISELLVTKKIYKVNMNLTILWNKVV